MRTCCPLSTRSPVAGSMNADARPPSDGRASSTSTRHLFSAKRVAALSPAKPAPMTMTCRQFRVSNSQKRSEPQPKRDDGTLRTRYTNARAEDVVPVALDAFQNLEVDAAHDLRGNQTAGIFGGSCPPHDDSSRVHVRTRTRAGPRRGASAGQSQVVFAHVEAAQIFRWQIDAPTHDVRSDVADDVRQLKRQPEIHGVLSRAWFR